MKMLVVGGGSIGARHLRNARDLGLGPLAVVEPDAERRGSVTTECHARGFATLEDGLAWRPEIAVIATPTGLHVPRAIQAARAGCHLLIEKPLSHAREGIETLAREIEQRRLIVLVACNVRFHPGPAAVKALLNEATIGTVVAARLQTGSYLPSWHPDRDYRQSYSASEGQGGAILDCSHEIDLALWFFGPAEVAGAASIPASSLGLVTDGLAEILLRHQSGVLSSVHLNFVQRDYRRCCQVIGTRGTIYWDYGTGRVDVFGEDGRPSRAVPQPADWDANQMYVDELSHFVACVRERRPTVNPLGGGVAALRIALAAREKGVA
jgi:predicted dehydrogenase